EKEVIGQFKNQGREWQAGGQETEVNVSDYLSIADGKRSPLGSLIWSIIAGSSLLAWIMLLPSLPWRVFDAGGSVLEKTWTSAVKRCSFSPMAVVPMGPAIGSGRSSCKTSPPRLGSRSPFAICLRRRANGTRSSIDSFPPVR